MTERSEITAQAQAVRDQRHAKVVDREVAPLWHDRFASMLWRHLPVVPPSLTLDVHSGPGRTTAELLDRLDPASKVVGLEPSAAMRMLAKSRIDASWKDRVYLKGGDMTDVADMGDATYDLVVANLVLGEAHDLLGALRALVRVTKPGGTVLATLPMHGTWAEAEDLFREVLRDAGLDAAVQRLRRLRNLRPTGHEIARALGSIGLPNHHFIVEQDPYELLFRSGREFLFSPIVEYGPLRLWKAICADQGNPQELFWRLKEAIDAYYAGRVFSSTIRAGLLRIEIPVAVRGKKAPAGAILEYWRQFPNLDGVFRRTEQRDRDSVGDDDDIDIDLEESESSGVAVVRTSRSTDDSLLALLEQPDRTEASDAELDALLDQVLEFAGPKEQVEEIPDEELEEVDGEGSRSSGDTLQRIRALLPPPPSAARRPPPPPKKRGS